MDDIPLLARELLMKLSNGSKQITPAMMKRLKEYDWPGNIRELDSLINRYVVLLGAAKHDDGLLTDLLGELRSVGYDANTQYESKGQLQEIVEAAP